MLERLGAFIAVTARAVSTIGSSVALTRCSTVLQANLCPPIVMRHTPVVEARGEQNVVLIARFDGPQSGAARRLVLL